MCFARGTHQKSSHRENRETHEISFYRNDDSNLRQQSHTKPETPRPEPGRSRHFAIIFRASAVIIIFPLMSMVSPVISTMWLM